MKIARLKIRIRQVIAAFFRSRLRRSTMSILPGCWWYRLGGALRVDSGLRPRRFVTNIQPAQERQLKILVLSQHVAIYLGTVEECCGAALAAGGGTHVTSAALVAHAVRELHTWRHHNARRHGLCRHEKQHSAASCQHERTDETTPACISAAARGRRRW